MYHAATFATGYSHRIIGMNLVISPTTVGQVVEICGATSDALLSKDFFKALSLETKWIKMNINFKFNFPNYLTTGKYVIIQPPQCFCSVFYNYQRSRVIS